MTTYWLDINRGNDSNSGTSQAQAWRNLFKLETIRWIPGDLVLFADDSEWYQTTRVVLKKCDGSPSQPIVFARYSPGGGTSRSYPIFRSRYAPQAADWSYDEDEGAWYVVEPNNARLDDVQGTGVMLLGPTKSHGVFIRRFQAPRTQFAVAGQWSMNPAKKRYYLYAPRSTNPTDFYGGVVMGIPAEAFPALLFLRCGSYVQVRGLKFQECGNGVTVGLYSGATTDGEHFQMIDCVGYNVGTLVRLVGDYKPGEFEFVTRNSLVEGNRIERCATAGIRLLNVANPTIKNNVGSDATGRSWAIGFVYVDSANDHPRTGGGLIHGNRFSRAAHATEYAGSDNAFDGAAIYCEAGSRNIDIRGNVVTDCHTAFQDNSGRGEGNTWIANIADRCGRGILITDADEIGTGSSRFINNLCVLNGGGVTMSSVDGVKGETRRAAMFSGRGNNTAMFANNIFLARKPAAYGLQVRASQKVTVINNIFHAFGMPCADLGGRRIALDTSNRTVDPQLVDVTQPELGLLPTSPALGAGTTVEGLLDHVGPLPNIGPWGVLSK